MDQTFMKEKKIGPLVLSMAFPMMLSMAFSSLYNIVDSYFVAKLSEDAMTALSLVYPAQNLLTAIAVGFGVGINALIAFYLGAGDQKRADKTATQGMVLGTLHGLVLMAVFLLGMSRFLGLFTESRQVLTLGCQYSNVHYAGKDLSGGRTDAGNHDQHDRRFCNQYPFGSAPDLWDRPLSQNGDHGGGSGNRNWTGGYTACLCVFLP